MNRAPMKTRSAEVADERWRLAERAAAAQAPGGEGIEAVARETGHAQSTLRRWARVARAFPSPNRAAGLSFSHHEAVAGTPNRLELIAIAAERNLSVGQLKVVARVHGIEDTDGRDTVTVRSLQTLDEAISYCEALVSVGGAGSEVRQRAGRLAELASTVASSAARPAREA